MEKHFNPSGGSSWRASKRRADDVPESLLKVRRVAPGRPSPSDKNTGDKCARGLPVLPGHYDLRFPDYRQPVEIGCFSLDSHRQLFNDDRQLKYCRMPSNKKPHFDLRDGFKDRYIKRNDDIKEKLDHILRWILLNKHKFPTLAAEDGSPAVTNQLHTDFITWRGHLTKILTTPYENREGWLMAVSLFNGTYYMSEVETEEARRQRQQRTEQQEELMYGGYKFEQYLCADKPDGSPDPAGVVNTNEAFCCVVRTRLNDHSLVFSGEVDCKDGSDPRLKAPQCYLELKTSREIYSANQERNFLRFKLLKWWAQSFLPGVPQIIAGFRNDNGTVVSLQTFETMKIHQLVKNEWNCWKPAVCLNFCNAFLSFVKHVVTQDNHRMVTLFSWEPGKDISYSVHLDGAYTFVPDWYVRSIIGHTDASCAVGEEKPQHLTHH
ncbi:decapping and exoribonuclease protein [Pristis pectinata]|uniref:decapping and exoribonuclease protein n=1 Tax=Pristis pectinata TaxID=685728 RepID=UPI00223E50D7|nr:decapping and exoribonuclease protein [Pristis pectinata]XP_051877776.1 decapping and exoribonuclease protein [Pristis pectinata]XP_051877777.1 decapping and exoribonuclease protein [Pristis pectinata]XP_051877778.1 decapping and exoribonuclease protein [Pristis pectinata]XP_051877779.1 decapping and exoribonuclease protein [Pristis pectinata]XP_051877780.1 decapping and exoribonuclease protein [Pristis pectinata]